MYDVIIVNIFLGFIEGEVKSYLPMAFDFSTAEIWNLKSRSVDVWKRVFKRHLFLQITKYSLVSCVLFSLHSKQLLSANGIMNPQRRWFPCYYPTYPCCSQGTVKPNVSTWSFSKRCWVTPLRAVCLWRRAGSSFRTPSSTLPPVLRTALPWPCGWTIWRSICLLATCPCGRPLVLITPAKALTSGSVRRPQTLVMLGRASPPPAAPQEVRMDTWVFMGQAECPLRSTVSAPAPTQVRYRLCMMGWGIIYSRGQYL